MPRDEVTQLAKEVGAEISAYINYHYDEAVVVFYKDQLERFAALVAAAERERAIEIAKGMQEELEAKFEQTYMQGVIAGAAAEREACAKVCEKAAEHNPDDADVAYAFADAIRARGE
jgi:hypothetical protein